MTVDTGPSGLSRTWPLLGVSPASRWPDENPARLAAQYLRARLGGDHGHAQAVYDVTGDAELAEGMTRVAAILALHLSRTTGRPLPALLTELVEVSLGSPGPGRQA